MGYTFVRYYDQDITALIDSHSGVDPGFLNGGGQGKIGGTFGAHAPSMWGILRNLPKN